MTSTAGGVERRLGIAALIMTGGVLLSRLTGHLREVLIVALHGAGRTTDVYYAAFTIPDLLNYLLAGGALSIAFLPIFSEYLATGREEEGWRVFSVIATTMTSLLLLLVVAGEVFAPWLAPLVAPGFDAAQTAELVRLTRIVMPAQLAFYFGGLIQATLYARERFLAPALAPLVYNLVTLAGGLLLRHRGVEGFAWGVLVGAFLGPLLVPLLAARGALRYRPAFSLRHPGLVRFVLLSLPLMLGVSLLTVDQWISRWFASSMTATITHLENARRLMQVPTAVFGQAAGMAALPFLARLAAEGRRDELGRVLGVALRGVLEVTVAAGAWLAVLAGPVVLLVFGWGRNTLESVEATATLLVAFSLGIPCWGVQGVAVRGFYARQDTFTPMLVSSLAVGLSLPLYWLLVRLYGAFGLALATSLGMGLTVAATLLALRYRGVAVYWGDLLATFVRSLVAALFAGGAAWGSAALLEPWLSPRVTLEALLLVLVCSLVYAAVLLLLARPLRLQGVLLVRDRVLGKLGRVLRRRPPAVGREREPGQE